MAAQPVLTPEQIAALNALVGTPAAEPRGMDFTAEMADETPQGMDFTEETASTQGPLPLVNPWEGERPQHERQLPSRRGSSGIPTVGTRTRLPGEGIADAGAHVFGAPTEMPLPGRQAQSLEPMDARPELNPSQEVGAFRAAQGMPQQSGQMTGEQAAQMAAAPRQEPNQPPTVNTQPLEPDVQTASVAEHHAMPPEVASSAAESPGATTTEMRADLDRADAAAAAPTGPQQAKGGAPSPEADVFTRLKQVTEAQPSEELETAQRRTAILRAMQGILGVVGGAAGMADNPMARKVGSGMQMGAAALPADLPMANYEQEVGERELAREGILDEATAGNARAQAVNQRMAMENAQDRTQLQREAQEFDMEGVATERAYQEGQRSTTGQPADDIRERIRGLSSGVNRENRPDFPSEQEIERVLAAGSPEELNELETTLNAMIKGTAPRPRRGRGGGGGGGRAARNLPGSYDELRPALQDIVDQGVREGWFSSTDVGFDAVLMSLEADKVPQRLADLHRLRGGTRAARDDNRDYAADAVTMEGDQDIIENAARAIRSLDDAQIDYIQQVMANRRDPGGGFLPSGELGRGAGQAVVNAFNDLSEEDRQEAIQAMRPIDIMIEKAARELSGAAINRGEWVRFDSQSGGDWFTQTPAVMRQAIVETARLHSRFMERTMARMPHRRSPRVEGTSGPDDGPAPIMVEFVNRGPNGEIVIVDTAPRGSARYRELLGTTDGHRTLEGE